MRSIRQAEPATRVPPAPNCSLWPLRTRVHLYTFASLDEHALLDYFLAHYASQGVLLESHAHVVLHTPTHDSSEEQLARRVLESHGVLDVSAASFRNLTKLEEHKLGNLNRLINGLARDAYVIFANVDELFEYPCDIVTRLESIRRHYREVKGLVDAPVDSKGYSMQFAVCAHMLDRYNTLDNTPGLPLSSREVQPVRSSSSTSLTLEEQFPVCGRVRGLVLGMTALKLTLVRAHVGNRTTRYITEHHAAVVRGSCAIDPSPRLSALCAPCTSGPLPPNLRSHNAANTRR